VITVAWTKPKTGLWSLDGWTRARARARIRHEEETTMPETETPTLRGIPEIRAYFRTNQTPIYFVSPTAFNLLGIDRWLRGFFYINYFDSFEGSHPRVFVPKERPYREFESMEDVCNHLLEHKEVLDRIERGGQGGKAVFVMFDDATEKAAAAAGLEIAHPSAELRHRLDSKSSPRSSATRPACRARRTRSAVLRVMRS
jgi:hypothetical protein